MRNDGREIICFLGIGSNIGETLLNCCAAVDRIADIDGVTLLRKSSFYKTEPVGSPDLNWFTNAVVEIKTRLCPSSLLQKLQEIEAAMGRTAKGDKGPRIIDIDILFYGQEIVQETDLTIPHPELHRRRFVLVPLNELAQYVMHPLFGVSARGLLDRLEDSKLVEPINKMTNHASDR